MNPLRPSLFIHSLQYIGGTPCTNFELVSSTEQDRKSDKPPQSITRATGNPNVIEHYGLYEGTTDQKTACFPGFSFGLENNHIFPCATSFEIEIWLKNTKKVALLKLHSHQLTN